MVEISCEMSSYIIALTERKSENILLFTRSFDISKGVIFSGKGQKSNQKRAMNFDYYTIVFTISNG